MVELDYIILKVNELDKSVVFYTEVLGFENAGVDGPFTVIRTGENFRSSLRPGARRGLSIMRLRSPERSSMTFFPG